MKPEAPIGKYHDFISVNFVRIRIFQIVEPPLVSHRHNAGKIIRIASIHSSRPFNLIHFRRPLSAFCSDTRSRRPEETGDIIIPKEPYSPLIALLHIHAMNPDDIATAILNRQFGVVSDTLIVNDIQEILQRHHRGPPCLRHLPFRSLEGMSLRNIHFVQESTIADFPGIFMDRTPSRTIPAMRHLPGNMENVPFKVISSTPTTSPSP